MENNSNLRTLYLIQVITVVVLVLILIMHVLPFFGLGPGGGGNEYINPSGGKPPSGYQQNVPSHVSSALRGSVLIPPIALG